MNKAILFGGILIAGIFLGVGSFNDAHAAAYIKFDGVDGESKDDKHDKWIDVLNVDWGIVDKNIEMSISKSMDTATPLLMQATCQGKRCTSTSVEIDICRDVDDSKGSLQQCYLKYEIPQVVVTSYQFKTLWNFPDATSAIEHQPIEHVTLNFEKIKVTYTPFDDKGNPGIPVTGFYEKGNKAAG